MASTYINQNTFIHSINQNTFIAPLPATAGRHPPHPLRRRAALRRHFSSAQRRPPAASAAWVQPAPCCSDGAELDGGACGPPDLQRAADQVHVQRALLLLGQRVFQLCNMRCLNTGCVHRSSVAGALNFAVVQHTYFEYKSG